MSDAAGRVRAWPDDCGTPSWTRTRGRTGPTGRRGSRAGSDSSRGGRGSSDARPAPGPRPVGRAGSRPVSRRGPRPVSRRGSPPRGGPAGSMCVRALAVSGLHGGRCRRGRARRRWGGSGGGRVAVAHGTSVTVTRGSSVAVRRGSSVAVRRGTSVTVRRGTSVAVARGTSVTVAWHVPHGPPVAVRGVLGPAAGRRAARRRAARCRAVRLRRGPVPVAVVAVAVRVPVLAPGVAVPVCVPVAVVAMAGRYCRGDRGDTEQRGRRKDHRSHEATRRFVLTDGWTYAQ
jgi:hypothetical protein